jgi:hypothetical protein
MDGRRQPEGFARRRESTLLPLCGMTEPRDSVAFFKTYTWAPCGLAEFTKNGHIIN